ncbi:hypothetical protein HanPSC8_Chr04g0160631 [Helianthus annuus]|nr:hypothetical protein HanHA89_Chr04g0149951 [Helianthus annuus]KAJ0931349.1 hypothetical protein HanPSC8_Chr04g0160631 [Helianthus annuus]
MVDEPEEDETEADVEENQDRLSPETERLMKYVDDTFEAGKSASKVAVDDEEKSLSGSDDEIDIEVDKWIRVNFDPRDRLIKKKRKRSTDDDDETYVPTPEHVQVEKTPPSGGRKKSTSRKCVVSPAVRKLKITLKSKPIQESQSKPPSPSPQQSSPPQQPSPPHQPSPQQPSPPHQPSPQHLHSPQLSPQHHISTPIHEQPFITSPHILQTPPTTQPPVQTTPGSSGFKDFPPIPEQITLEKLDDFSFVNDDLVKKLQKKVDEVLVEKRS